MDRRLLTFSIAAFTLELILFLGLSGVLPLPFLSTPDSTRDRNSVGEVEVARQNVRRRGFDSNIWEDSLARDRLFENDSILTLSGSAAKLKLQNDVKIELHENTLVVLESLDPLSDKPFRLRFARGDLRAQNARTGVQLKSGDWAITAQAGSDLSLRAVDSGRVEVEVNSGTAMVRHSIHGLEREVGAEQRVMLYPEEASTVVTTSQNLVWADPREQKIYAHRFPIQAAFKWEGDASTLQLLSPTQGAKAWSLKKGQRSARLDLNPGSYHLTLADGDRISKTLSVQVLRAPRIVHLTPLPRDRVKLESEVLFSWMSELEVGSYRLEFARDPEFTQVWQSLEVLERRATIALKNNGPQFWRVVAFDEENFVIPAAYAYPIHAHPDPLRAPTLRAPSSVDEGSVRLRSWRLQALHIFWIWIVPQVEGAPPKKNDPVRPPQSSLAPQPALSRQLSHPQTPPSPPQSPQSRQPRLQQQPVQAPASQPRQSPHARPQPSQLSQPSKPPARTKGNFMPPVIFNWERLEGADYYIIEISSSPTFEDPDLIAKVSTNFYAWGRFKKQVYYYRVAGGAEPNRVGVFSTPEKIDLTIWPKPITATKAAETENKTATQRIPQPLSSNPATMRLTPLPTSSGAGAPSTSTPSQPQSSLLPPTSLSSPPPRPSPSPMNAAPMAPSKPESLKPTTPTQITGGIWWQPSYRIESQNGSRGVSAALAGGSLMGLGFETKAKTDSGVIWAQGSWQTVVWKPKNKNDLPFQNKITTNQAHLQVGVGDFGAWHFGGRIETMGRLVRVDLERVESRSQMAFGPFAGYRSQLGEAWEHAYDLSLVLNGKFQEATATGAWRLNLSGWQVGGRAKFSTAGRAERASAFEAGLQLGWHFE